MGIFDLPQESLSTIDAFIDFLPLSVRIGFWGFWSALISMAVYALLSPQKRLAAIVLKTTEVKLQLADQDTDDFAAAMKIYKTAVRLALQRLLLTLAPSLIAVLPVLCMIAWIATNFSYRFPERTMLLPASAQPADVPVVAQNVTAGSQTEGSTHLRILVLDDRKIVMNLVLTRPIPIIEKRHWWHLFFGNLNGYLPPDAPVESVSIELPPVQVLPIGPEWLRGWEPLYFTIVLLFSVIIKTAARLK